MENTLGGGNEQWRNSNNEDRMAKNHQNYHIDLPSRLNAAVLQDAKEKTNPKCKQGNTEQSSDHMWGDADDCQRNHEFNQWTPTPLWGTINQSVTTTPDFKLGQTHTNIQTSSSKGPKGTKMVPVVFPYDVALRPLIAQYSKSLIMNENSDQMFDRSDASWSLLNMSRRNNFRMRMNLPG